MRRRNIIALFIFAVFYFVTGILITLFQERLVYHPSPQDFYNCPALPEAEPVTHAGTRMYVSEPDKPVVVLYHGNAGSACDRAFYTDLFTDAGYGYVLVEYAGYSDDEETPSHDAIKEDMANVIAYFETASITPAVVVGESIGTGIASYHAALAPPLRLLLISPFTDLRAVARDRFWFYPTRFLVDNAYNNVTNLTNYPGDVAIIHGTADTVIPYQLGEALYDSLGTNKTLTLIPEAGHNDLFIFSETYTAISEFLNQ